MFRFNLVTRVLMNVETGGDATSHLDFNPTEVQQGVGLLDMKEEAQALEAQQEETGSTSADEEVTAPVVDDKATGEQSAGDAEKTSENAPEESLEGTTPVEAEYTYKGVAVSVETSQEVKDAFKEKELDVDAINKELYSEDGISKETREKLDTAFGKLSVDMYLEGVATKNEAMLNEHNANSAKDAQAIDDIVNEATGDNFDAVMKWASDNLDDKEYKSYADIINGTDAFQVKMAITNLVNQSGLKPNKLEAPKVKATDQMLGADNSSQASQSDAIGSLAYRKAITSGEYAKDMAGWDKRRQAGLDAGLV